MSFWRASLHHLFVCTCHVLCIYREKKLTKLFAFCNTTFHTFTGSCCVQYHEYTTTLTYHLRPGISSRLREEVFLKSSGLLVVLVLRDSELRRIWLNSCCLELAVHEWIKTFPILLLLYTKKNGQRRELTQLLLPYSEDITCFKRPTWWTITLCLAQAYFDLKERFWWAFRCELTTSRYILTELFHMLSSTTMWNGILPGAVLFESNHGSWAMWHLPHILSPHFTVKWKSCF